MEEIILSPKEFYEYINLKRISNIRFFASRICKTRNNKFSIPYLGYGYKKDVEDIIIKYNTMYNMLYDYNKLFAKEFNSGEYNIKIPIDDSPKCNHLILDNLKPNNIFKKIEIKDNSTWRPYNFNGRSFINEFERKPCRSIDDIFGYYYSKEKKMRIQRAILTSEIFIENPTNFLYKISSKAEQSEEEVSLFNKISNEVFNEISGELKEKFKENFNKLNKELKKIRKKLSASNFQITSLPPTYSENIRVVNGNIILEQSIHPTKYYTLRKLLIIFESMWLAEYLVNRTLEFRRDAHVKFPTTNWKVEIRYNNNEDIKLVYYDKNELEDLILELRGRLKIK